MSRNRNINVTFSLLGVKAQILIRVQFWVIRTNCTISILLSEQVMSVCMYVMYACLSIFLLSVHFAVRAHVGLKLHRGVVGWSVGTNTTFPGALTPWLRAN